MSFGFVGEEIWFYPNNERNFKRSKQFDFVISWEVDPYQFYNFYS